MGPGRLHACLHHLHRPERHGSTGPEAAGEPGARLGEEGRVALEAMPRQGQPAVRVHLEARHGQRRHRLHEVRVQQPQQAGGELRQLAVQRVLDAGGEEGEGLEEPLHVRVHRVLDGEPQARGDLRVARREPGPLLAQVEELALVGPEQLVLASGHARPPRAWTAPAPRAAERKPAR
jgi:hypothetical protein